MKHFFGKDMATGLLSILVVFFMLAPVPGMAQKNMSMGNPSAGSGADKTVSELVLPVEMPAQVPLEPAGQKIMTRSGSSNVVKITSKGTDTEYDTWTAAMQALESGEQITLLSDLILYEDSGDKMPDKPCTIDGGSHTLTFAVGGYVNNCTLQGDVTFKNICLNAVAMVANGKKLVLDNGVTVKDYCTVYGGGYETDVENTSITIKSGATLEVVCGGGYAGKVTGNTNIVVEGGTVSAIVGGGNLANAVVEGNTNITIKNTTLISSVYGGGANAPVKETANITIEGGTVKYVLGGGSNESATCKNTNLEIKGGTFGQSSAYYKVMGGGYSAPVEEKAKVTISGGTFYNYVMAGGGFDGATTATCGSTELIITGGTFNRWMYGGGWSAPVLGTATVKVSGTPAFSNTLFGGGLSATATCNATDVNISGGNFSYIYGGGGAGDVTGECHLKISGTPTITENVFGGSDNKNATVGSTRVEISGGTFATDKSIFAGGWGCKVTGNTSLIATGGTLNNLYGGCSQGEVIGSTYIEVNGATMGGTITGGGYGDDVSTEGHTYDASLGRVGSTQVVIKKIISSHPGTSVTSEKTFIYGGGLYAGVIGNTYVRVEDGSFGIVCGGCNTENIANTLFKGTVGGDVNVIVTGGEMRLLTAARDQIPGKPVPVGGKMNLTIEGGVVTNEISSGMYSKGSDYKSCTLTVRNLGNDSAPYTLPKVAYITDLVLDGSTVNMLPSIEFGYPGFSIVEDYPLTITGNGKLIGTDILLKRTSSDSQFSMNKPLVIADLPRETTFAAYKKTSYDSSTGTPVSIIETTPVYKAGKTYRSQKQDDKTTTLRKVNITHPANGKISAVWDKVKGNDTVLEDGDYVPDGTTLTLSVVPDEGYQGGTIFANGSKLTGSTYTVTADVSFTVEGITAIPYLVTVATPANGSITATPNTDVTIGTKVDLSIIPSDGYRLKAGSLKTHKTGEESQTVTLSGNSFNMPAYDVTVTAEFEKIPIPIPDPEPVVYYHVTIPEVAGVATDPVAGQYQVESWGSFRFYLTLDKGYDKSEPVVTTDRGETITPRSSDGAYIVKYVRSDVEISIDGIVKNPDPVANAEIQSGTKAWVKAHRLFMRTDRVEDVSVYTFAGELIKTFRSKGGDEAVSLPAGSYIVRIGEKRFKVIL